MDIHHYTLHYKKNYKDIVEYLVSHGANVNITNKYGETPLHIASENGNKNIVEYLVSHGAK